MNLMNSAPGSSSNVGAAESLLLNPNGVVVHEQTVEFNEDGEVAQSTETPMTTASNFLVSAGDSLENSIKDFMARPIVVDEFEWTSAQIPATAVIPGIDLPFAWFAKTMIKSKLLGFRYFRGTAVLRIQVNAQPFNAGRLIGWFVPFRSSLTAVASSESHFGGITGYRHVELDVGESTSAEIRIPFMCPLTHIDLLNATGTMGTFRIYVYSALTGIGNVEGSVWMHFEDIDLQMPTGHPQIDFTLERYTIQANDKIGSEKKKGDIENLLSSTSSVARKLGDIPIVGEAAKGIAWFSDIGAGVAGMFGWSKPTEDDIVTAVDLKYVRNFANFNGKAFAKPMGLDARNQTETPRSVFGTNEDEMALAAIVQKPLFTSRFSITATNAPGTIVFKWPVHPGSCEKNTASSVTVWNNTYLSYLSQLFTFWRGGLCYNFKMVKTPFHSVRFRVVWVPGADLDTDLTTIDRDMCYTKVIDSRDANSFAFTIPFVSNAIWMPIRHDVNTINPSAILSDTPTGLFFIEILNSLRNPNTAANNIEILMESFAADDFQFAYLTRKQDLQIVGADVQPFPPPPERFTVQYMAQPENLFESRKMSDFLPNVISMGEAVTSLRQVLKRYTRMFEAPIPVTDPTNTTTLYPYTTQQSGQVTDTFSYISQIYRLMSGGVRILFSPAADSAGTITNIALEPYGTTDNGNTAIITAEGDAFLHTVSNPQALYFPALEEYLELDIPFYQPYPTILTPVGRPKLATDIDGVPLHAAPYNRGTALEMINSIPLFVHRMIGEDFNFGYLIGVPQTSFTSPPLPTIEEEPEPCFDEQVQRAQWESRLAELERMLPMGDPQLEAHWNKKWW